MRAQSRSLTVLVSVGLLASATLIGCSAPASAPETTSAAPAAPPQERGGQDEFGPYEVAQNWPQPLPDGRKSKPSTVSRVAIENAIPRRVWRNLVAISGREGVKLLNGPSRPMMRPRKYRTSLGDVERMCQVPCWSIQIQYAGLEFAAIAGEPGTTGTCAAVVLGSGISMI